MERGPQQHKLKDRSFNYTQSLRQFLRKDQYIPALRCRKAKKNYEFHPAWEFLSSNYDDLLADAAERMPPSAAPNFETASVLRHCAEVLLRQAAGQAKLTQALQKKVEGTFLLIACIPPMGKPWYTATDRNLGQQWMKWRRRVVGAGEGRQFQLALQLHEPDTERPEQWWLEFRVWSRRDPSLQVPLAEYWPMINQERMRLLKEFGPDFEAALLVDMSQAAHFYPALWEALDTAEPTGVVLALEDAFTFLTETSWILEDAGYRVIVPAWWTPQGRRRDGPRLASEERRGFSRILEASPGVPRGDGSGV